VGQFDTRSNEWEMGFLFICLFFNLAQSRTKTLTNEDMRLYNIPKAEHTHMHKKEAMFFVIKISQSQYRLHTYMKWLD